MTQQNLADARAALAYEDASEDERACYWTAKLRKQAQRGCKVLETHEVIRIRGYRDPAAWAAHIVAAREKKRKVAS